MARLICLIQANASWTLRWDLLVRLKYRVRIDLKDAFADFASVCPILLVFRLPSIV